MRNNIRIGKKLIGDSKPCLIVAEIGLAHDGSLGEAHAFIDAISKTGVDAVKFQTHIAESESSKDELFRVNIFPQDKTRYDYWKRTSFTETQWLELKKHTEEKGLIFMSTPFSLDAVKMLRRIGVKAWKIGSGDTNNLLMLDEIMKSHEPILLSSGMSYIEELDKIVSHLKNKKAQFLLMQCTNKYPCPPEKLGLNIISEYKNRYRVPVGFSDHSGEIGPCISAVTYGAKVVEVHVTWHKDYFGPDVKASLTLEELSLMTKNIRLVERAILNPIDKDILAKEMDDMRYLFTKGIVASKNIKKGEKIKKAHLDSRKPCNGIPVYDYEKIIGMQSLKTIKKGNPIKWKHLK